MFFRRFYKCSGLWAFSVFPWCQCVYTGLHAWKKNRQMAGRTPVPQHQNWQSSENHSILRKSTIFNEHPVPTCFGLLLVKYQNWKDLTDMWTDGGKGRNSIFFYTSHFHFVKKIKSQIIFVCKGGPWIHENIIHM